MSNDLDASDDYALIFVIRYGSTYYHDAITIVSATGSLIPYDIQRTDKKKKTKTKMTKKQQQQQQQQQQCRDLFVLFLFLSKKKKKSKINTVLNGYYILNQINDMKFM